MRQFGIIVLLALALASLVWAKTGVAVSTTHFRFEGDAGSRALIKNLARVAEQKWRYVEQVLGPVDAAPITVIVASTNEAMARATGSTHWSQAWIAGVARPKQRHMVLSARGDGFFNVTDTFVHELTHIALQDATAGHPTPLWFQEGVAMLLASEESGERLKTLFSAAATNSLFEIGELSESFPPDPPAVHLAYAQALLFTRYLLKQGHGTGITSLIGMVRTGMPFDLAIETVFDASIPDLHARFLRSFGRFDAWLVVLTSSAVLWVLLSGLFLYVYLRKRSRISRMREAMIEAEAEADATDPLPILAPAALMREDEEPVVN